MDLCLEYSDLFSTCYPFYRSDTIESVLCGSLFPTGFSVKDRVRHWVRIFSGFDRIEMKALEKILEQKQRCTIIAWFCNQASCDHC